MMAESGIQLGDVMVGSESFSRNENNQQHGQQHARNMNHFGGQGETDPGMEKQTVSGGHNGIVNTFA